MEQRRSIPWLWVLVTLGLVVVVGAIAYYLGTTHPAAGQPMAFAHPIGQIGLIRFGHGAFGFWLPVLLLALVVGVVVAAIARPTRPAMTFEEWHRSAHAGQATGTTEPGAGHEHAGAHAETAGPAQAGEDHDYSGSSSSTGPSS